MVGRLREGQTNIQEWVNYKVRAVTTICSTCEHCIYCVGIDTSGRTPPGRPDQHSRMEGESSDYDLFYL